MNSAIAVARPTAPGTPWGPQASPVDPKETQIRIRAQSYLSGPLIDGVCPALTLEQAHDVLAWAGITI